MYFSGTGPSVCPSVCLSDDCSFRRRSFGWMDGWMEYSKRIEWLHHRPAQAKAGIRIHAVAVDRNPKSKLKTLTMFHKPFFGGALVHSTCMWVSSSVFYASNRAELSWTKRFTQLNIIHIYSISTSNHQNAERIQSPICHPAFGHLQWNDNGGVGVILNLILTMDRLAELIPFPFGMIICM